MRKTSANPSTAERFFLKNSTGADGAAIEARPLFSRVATVDHRPAFQRREVESVPSQFGLFHDLFETIEFYFDHNALLQLHKPANKVPTGVCEILPRCAVQSAGDARRGGISVAACAPRQGIQIALRKSDTRIPHTIKGPAMTHVSSTELEIAFDRIFHPTDFSPTR